MYSVLAVYGVIIADLLGLVCLLVNLDGKWEGLHTEGEFQVPENSRSRPGSRWDRSLVILVLILILVIRIRSSRRKSRFIYL